MSSPNSSITKKHKEESIKDPSHGKKADVNKIINLYQNGLSMNKIGRIVGHHHSIIRYHLLRSNIQIKSQSEAQRKRISSEKIKEMYLSGMSGPQIASELGVTYQFIYDRLAELNVKTRSAKETKRILIEKGLLKFKSGIEHKNWRGGRFFNKNGYVEIRINKKSISEHRYIWEKSFGPIPEGFLIHHLNGIKTDNKLENLVMLPRKHHSPRKILEPYKRRICQLENEINQIKNQGILPLNERKMEE